MCSWKLLRYNASEHPIPFHKAQDLGKVPKKLAGGSVPDIEDAYDVSQSLQLICSQTHLVTYTVRG